MKTTVIPACIFVAAIFAGCSKRESTTETLRQDADAKARAEAARKEMEVLPKAFRPRQDQRLVPPLPADRIQAKPTPSLVPTLKSP